jgi:hypothetical protein
LSGLPMNSPFNTFGWASDRLGAAGADVAVGGVVEMFDAGGVPPVRGLAVSRRELPASDAAEC